MKLTRRQTLGVLAGGGALAAAGGCSQISRTVQGPPPPLSPPLPSEASDRMALATFGYGPSAKNPDEIGPRGRSKWFEDQLAAPTDDPLPIMLKLRRLDIFHFTAYELRDLPQKTIIEQLQAAAIIRAVDSPWQLRERMVDFWSNHFNIFARKGLAAYRKPQDDREVIREHCLGSFPDMLMASAKSTAMLLYLDQQASSFVQPNENYARELLELHTLGVDAGYTQKDVMEAARAFTGWTEERGFLKGRGQFKFRPDLHDDGEKHVLGHTIPAGSGVAAGEKVLEIVSTHPATARHVARKLCRFFLGRDDDAVSGSVAKAYASTKGNIPAMLREVFAHFEAGRVSAVVKRPFDFCMSSLRALGAETDGGTALQGHLASMGQPLYQWPMPDGFPVDALSWTGSMLARWNFAHDLCSGAIGKTSVDAARLANLDKKGIASSLLGRPADSDEVRQLAARLGPSDEPLKTAALCLASPAFQWRIS